MAVIIDDMIITVVTDDKGAGNFDFHRLAFTCVWAVGVLSAALLYPDQRIS